MSQVEIEAGDKRGSPASSIFAVTGLGSLVFGLTCDQLVFLSTESDNF